MKTNQKIHVGCRTNLLANEIFLLKADLNYTKIFMLDGSEIFSSTNLGKIQKRLSGFDFVRPNRSTVVNRVFIQCVEIENSRIILQNNEVLRISRKRKVQFSNFLMTQLTQSN